MATKNAINEKTGSLSIDPGASGDSFVQFDINATGEFRVGVDDDDSDKFKVSQGSALGANDTFIMTSVGERTMPLQPAFMAYLGTTDSNVTGNGSTHTLGSGNALTEVYDQGSNFVTTGTFTASITGRYLLTIGVVLDNDGLGITELDCRVVTSNGTYRLASFNSNNVASGSDDEVTFGGSVQCDMDAADTATFTVRGTGGGADTADLISNNRDTLVAGFLMC